MLYSAQLLASLLPSSPNLELTPRTSVSFCSKTPISFHSMHEPVLGAGQKNAQSCDWEKLQREGALESCRPLHSGACEFLFSERKCHLKHKLVVSLPLYFVFIIFDSFTCCLAFFLTRNLLAIFSTLNPTYLCLWKGVHWFVCLDKLPLSCASALN